MSTRPSRFSGLRNMTRRPLDEDESIDPTASPEPAPATESGAATAPSAAPPAAASVTTPPAAVEPAATSTTSATAATPETAGVPTGTVADADRPSHGGATSSRDGGAVTPVAPSTPPPLAPAAGESGAGEPASAQSDATAAPAALAEAARATGTRRRQARPGPAAPAPSALGLGKRSDPDYTQISAYVRKDTYRRVKVRIVESDHDIDLSAVLEGLLAGWVGGRFKL